MSLNLPNLPQEIINKIFYNYSNLSNKGWYPSLTNKDKIVCRINIYSSQYDNICEVLKNKQKNIPEKHSLMINYGMEREKGITYTIKDDELSLITYTVYENNERDKIGYLYIKYEKLSNSIYFTKGNCNFTYNFHNEDIKPKIIPYVYEIKFFNWILNLDDDSIIMSLCCVRDINKERNRNRNRNRN